MNIGAFRDVEELGHGGMGSVYTGFYQGKKIAIKKFRTEFLQEAELIERFKLEAQTLKRLNHPAIVKIVEPPYQQDNRFYPAFVEGGELYLAMEFIEGETINRFVHRNGGPLDEERAVRIMCNILDAMEYVRQNKIIHRDIKPSNIIVRPDGETVCIIDFGIVKDMNSSGLTTGQCVLGTDGYMSPEQAAGMTVDCRTDIYSLGCLLFYMLTGRHAIENKASVNETRIAILKGTFPKAQEYNPKISDHVQRVIDKATCRNMLTRFQTPREFKLALTGGTLVDTFAADTISVGRDQSSDIHIFDPHGKVSRHHLDIEYQNTTMGRGYRIIDRSTNGTQVNGQFIRRESVFVPSDGHGQMPYPPQVILAGVVELDWDEVVSKFRDDEFVEPEPPGGDSTPPAPHPDNLSFGYGLLSFIFPIVGWVLYFQWRGTTPQKAKQAAIVAWISFGISTIIRIILMFN